MSTVNVTEKCACGSTYSLTGADAEAAESFSRKWRKRHAECEAPRTTYPYQWTWTSPYDSTTTTPRPLPWITYGSNSGTIGTITINRPDDDPPLMAVV